MRRKVFFLKKYTRGNNQVSYLFSCDRYVREFFTLKAFVYNTTGGGVGDEDEVYWGQEHTTNIECHL